MPNHSGGYGQINNITGLKYEYHVLRQLNYLNCNLHYSSFMNEIEF